MPGFKGKRKGGLTLTLYKKPFRYRLPVSPPRKRTKTSSSTPNLKSPSIRTPSLLKKNLFQFSGVRVVKYVLFCRPSYVFISFLFWPLELRLVISSDIFWYLLVSSGIFWYLLVSSDIFWYLLIYSGIFWYILVSSDIFWYLHTFLSRKSSHYSHWQLIAE